MLAVILITLAAGVLLGCIASVRRANRNKRRAAVIRMAAREARRQIDIEAQRTTDQMIRAVIRARRGGFQ